MPNLTQWISLKLSRIEDPLLFHRTIDRYVGFLHWNLRTLSTRIKLLAIFLTFLYLTIAVLSIPMIDPTTVPIDFYFGMWFLFGAGGSCFTQWLVLAHGRHKLREVIRFLTDLQRRDRHHPMRVRSRPRILVFVVLYWAQNVGQAVYWALTLKHTSPIQQASQFAVVKVLASWLYPPIIVMLGQMSDITQVMTFNTLLVFTVEFEILADDFRQAIDCWNVGELRECVRRHRRLLANALVFRDKLRMYLMLTLEIYFFLITYACFVMVIQLTGNGGSRSLFTILTGVVSIVCLILFGWVCDRLEVKASDVGRQVYNSDWPSNFIYREDNALDYRFTRKNLLIVMMRAQNRIRFSCGSVLDMSLETSYQLLKLCYSAFTILLSMIRNWSI
uniref:odorant receptor 75 n=1 Tax=Aedes aegypti TaxID=7159 RepID=UPI000C2B6B86|nr:odorant receptor 75 [Aedes aegypti]